LLDGGKLVRYGAKSLPYGGWYAMPRNYSTADWSSEIPEVSRFAAAERHSPGDKDGMLAAETIFDALKQATLHRKR